LQGSENGREVTIGYIPLHFYGQPSQIYKKKNAKVRVERSPIFKDRFFYNMEIFWEMV
jgi:hypothetical protein